MFRHRNNAVSESHSKHYPLVFLPADVWKVLPVSDTIAKRLFGRKVQIICDNYTKFLMGPSLLCWLASIVEFFFILVHSSYLPFGLFVAFVIPSTLISLCWLLGSNLSTTTQCLKKFETSFILSNMVVNTYVLSFKVQERTYYWTLIPVYLLSYTNAVICEAGQRNFGAYEVAFKAESILKHKSVFKEPSLQSTMVNRNQTKFEAKLLRGIFHGRLITLLKSPFVRPSFFRRIFKRYFSVYIVTLTVFIGWLVQLYLYYLIQTQWIGSENVVIELGWMKWTDNEILSYTSVNTLIFLTKRVHSSIVDPFHPDCYRTGLLRIPLVDEWYELYNPVQPQEMKAIQDGSLPSINSSPTKHQQPNAAQNSKASIHKKYKGVANIDKELSSQNIEQHSNFQNYLKNPYFRSGAEQIPGDVFQKSRLLFVSPIRVRRLVFSGKSLLSSFRQRLSLKWNRLFHAACILCEISVPIFTVLSLVQVAIKSSELEQFKDALSYFCIISHILYMSNNTWDKIKRTFLAFENSYLLVNTIVLWISFAHMFHWKGYVALQDFTIVCIAFVRSIIFETYNINWKRFAARMKDTLVPAYRRNPDAMPLTTLILQAIHANPDIDAIAENTLHKKPSTMNVVPIRPCVETPITSTIADKAVAFTISPLERSIYHTLLGPDRMLLYVFNILIQLSLLIMLEGDLIMHTHVRDIRLGFLRARNITVAKGAVFNLLIFSTKRLINLATNPMLSASFRQSYFLFPMTKSVIGALYDAGREDRVVGKDGNGDNQENGSGLNDKEEERGCEASSMSGVCRASNEGKHVEAVE